MSGADLLSNVEREPHDRPTRADPVVPDLIPPEKPWHGSAVGLVEHWKARALAAEGLVAELQQRLRHYRFTP